MDCLRYDRCGFNGHHRPTTPSLTKLAGESFVFDHAYATGPYTTESVPGIVAGQHSYNGAYFGHDPAWKALPPDSETLASHLQSHGYETLATLTNPHLTATRNFDIGFDHFHNLRTEGVDKAESDSATADNTTIYMLRERFQRSRRRITPSMLAFLAYRYYQYRTEWPTVDGEAVVEALRSRLQTADAPFFAWAHFMDPHAPINPQVAKGDRNGLSARAGTLRQLYRIGNHARERYDPLYDHLYDSAVRYVDEQLERIISALRSMNHWEETILIVTGDHGEVLYDRQGIYGHPRHHHYDESLRVPLLVRVPNRAGHRINRQVSLAWLPDLVTELIDLPQGNFPCPEGVATIFKDIDGSNPVVISDSLDEHGHTVSVRNGKYKLVSHINDGNTLETSYPYFEDDIVFKYRHDSAERTPIDCKPPQDLRSIADRIKTEPAMIPNIRGEFSQAVERRLKDLGYRME